MKVGIIGAGSWGTTLAVYLAKAGNDVALWAHGEEQRERLTRDRKNALYLPDVSFPDSLSVVPAVEETVHAPVIVIATPVQFIRKTLESVDPVVVADAIFVSTSKGIERGSLLRVSQLLNEILDVDPERFVCLSGPTHAEEVSRDDPAAIVAASPLITTAEKVQELFNSETLRVYATDDLIGVELGGSLKNVIALCAGIVDGLGLGDNSKAGLITRGLAEITRLGVALGAQANTFSGLSGLGDLVVTCTSRHSRNRYVGEQIGKGRKLKEIVEEMAMVAEGVTTTESVYQLALRNDVEMPITNQVYQILFEGKEPRVAIQELMSRETKQEVWT